MLTGVHMTYVVGCKGDAINEEMVAKLVMDSNAAASSVGGMVKASGATIEWAVRVEHC